MLKTIIRDERHWVTMSLLCVAKKGMPKRTPFELAELGPFDDIVAARSAGRHYATSWIDCFHDMHSSGRNTVARLTNPMPSRHGEADSPEGEVH